MIPEGNRPTGYQGIIQADKALFDRAIRPREKTASLPTEPDALRYMLIPERLLALVAEPSALDVVTSYHDTLGLEAFIISKTPLDGIVDNQGEPRTPLSADPTAAMNINKQNLVSEGLMEPEAEILLRIHLNAHEKEILYVSEYDDRYELRKLGIASSFYGRLRSVAQTLGFRFIMGINETERTIEFFKKRGRFSVSEMHPEYHDMFLESVDFNPTPAHTTVEFLNPKDIRVFVKPQYL